VPSRDEVDAVSAAALATGATEADGAQDYGFTYSRSFFDLDGHGWQVTSMDREAAAQGPEAFRGLHAGRRGLTHHDAPPIREGAPLAREPGTVILAA
jgi:hypothetical protein